MASGCGESTRRRPSVAAGRARHSKRPGPPWPASPADGLCATGRRSLEPDGAELAALTPGELQFALPLAAGRTTRRAAAGLFLSPKKVEYHLWHVHTKLSIASGAVLVLRLTRELGRARRLTRPSSVIT
jgi:DNA-binding CsgD family transcriptional regulator